VAAHRLKGRYEFHVTAALLDDATPLADELVWTHFDGVTGEQHVDTVALAQSAGASQFDTNVDFADGADDYSVAVSVFERSFTATDAPFVALDESGLALTATYATPKETYTSDGLTVTLTTTSQELVHLGHCPDVARPSELGRVVDLADMGTPVTMTGQVNVAPFPSGPSAGFTSGLVAWHGASTVSGLVELAPFTLDGVFSRTYVPGHHNFAQDLAFEPRLEPGFSGGAALDDADVAAVFLKQFPPTVVIQGLDGHLRIAP
jgi:hypothetical protein